MQRLHRAEKPRLELFQLVLHGPLRVVESAVSEDLLVRPQSREELLHHGGFGDEIDVRGAGLEEAALQEQD